MEGLLKAECECYQNGTYTLPNPLIKKIHVTNYTHCNGCQKEKTIVRCIRHNVHRSEDNPDFRGNWGKYCQLSYYCEDCWKMIWKSISEISQIKDLEYAEQGMLKTFSDLEKHF